MEYYWMIRNLSNVFDYRLKMVEYAREHGKSAAAREFKTTRKTVRKWEHRYKQNGLEGLRDFSKAPKRIPHKMSNDREAEIVALREKHPGWGSIKLKDTYGLNEGHSAIHRVIRQRGLIRKKRRRYKKRRDLSALKKRMKFFERSQIDTKDLSDIYKYWPYMQRAGLPRYEYTLRELSTGLTYYAYANRNNSTYASLFAKYVINHLRSYGIKTARIMWQTDNGSEYIGSVHKKINRLSAFEKVLGHFGIHHTRIPPRCAWLNGDVETFHKLVEEEFYDIESYESETEFLGKAFAYQLYFNNVRKNRYRDRMSPLDILKVRFPKVDPGVLNLPPIRLEVLLNHNWHAGYHVPRSAMYVTNSP